MMKSLVRTYSRARTGCSIGEVALKGRKAWVNATESYVHTYDMAENESRLDSGDEDTKAL